MNIPGVVVAEEIGAGGFATVYRGTQTVIGRDVAVKIDTRRLTAERDRRRFEREVTALGTVAAHPNIVTLYDAGITADDRPYLVMELCTGGSYGQRIKKSGAIGLAETIEVGIAIADALAAAHVHGILHRDVKPGNLLISQYGNPMLADFGLAALPRPGFDVSVTLESLTPAYSAPETFALQPPTVAADVFGLGTTMYAMLQGRAPHSDASGQPPSLPQLLYLLNSPLPALPDVPMPVMKVLWRATAAAPQDRFTDAVAFRDALRRLRPGNAAGHLPTDHRPSGAVVDQHTLRPTLGLPGATASESTGTHRPSGHRTGTGPLTSVESTAGTGAGAFRRTGDTGFTAGPAHPTVTGAVAAGRGAGDHTASRSLFGSESSGTDRSGVGPDPSRRGSGRRRGYALAGAVSVLLLGITAAVVIPRINSTGTAATPNTAIDLATVPVMTAVINAPTNSAPVIPPPGSSIPSTPTPDSPSTDPQTSEPPVTSAPVVPPTGECFGGLVVIADIASANRVACESPHYYESFASGVLSDDLTGVAMTDVMADPAVRNTCTTEVLEQYLGESPDDDLGIEVLPASEARFLAGDRTFRCLATEVGAGEVTGTLDD